MYRLLNIHNLPANIALIHWGSLSRPRAIVCISLQHSIPNTSYPKYLVSIPQNLEFVSFQQTRTIKRDLSEGYISDKSSSNEAVDQLSPEASERAGRRDVL